MRNRHLRYPARRSAAIQVCGNDPFGPLVEAYVHNLLVSMSVRQMNWRALQAVSDSDIIVEFARSASTGKPGMREVGSLDPERLRGLIEHYLRKCRRQPREIPGLPAPADRNMCFLTRLFELAPAEVAVLTALCTAELSLALHEALDTFGDLALPAAATLLARATGLPEDEVLASIQPEGRLVRSGLVILDMAPCIFSSKLQLKYGLVDLVVMPSLREEDVFRRFLPLAKAPSLAVGDFPGLREPVSLTQAILREALAVRRSGINVLLHGPTGTGKTELARIFAREVEAALYSVGNERLHNETSKTLQRLAALRLANQLLARSRSIVLFDEIEDLFRWDAASFSRHSPAVSDMSKQWFNEVLENNPVPTIWITNRVSGIDPAFLRRFSYVIEVKPPGAAQRARVLARHLGEGSALAAGDVEVIAQRFPVSPAQLGSAVAVARLAKGGSAPDRHTIEQILEPVHELVSGKRPERERVFDAGSYCMDALNTRDDLAAIVDRAARWVPDGGSGISMCLYGPPGTGKSEFARYLAYRMDRPVVYRRVSDIHSMWVGETERRIAGSFEEAREEDALLLFDEVDSFLRSRGSAVRSWEVTEVNEFLSQLESYEGVVVCTTNLWREIDEAALRRFVFKVEFRWPTAEQSWRLFEAMLAPHLAAPSDEERITAQAALARIPNLAPGDFAAVSRRLRFLAAKMSYGAALAELGREARVKRGPASAIGY